MAFKLTQTTRNLSQQLPVEPIIILEVDGISLSFGTDVIEKSWNFDEGELFDSGLFFDGVVADENSRGYIQEKGTTSTLTSQVEIEEGGIGSVQKFKINLIDKDNEVSKVFTPGYDVDDPLTRDANVFLGFKGGSHPKDSVRIFTGIVDSIKPGAGNVTVSLAHPDELKRQSIFQQQSAEIANLDAGLTSAINDTITTIPVTSALEYSGLETLSNLYIKINSEIILVGTVGATSFVGCTRGVKGTTAAAHGLNDTVSYTIQDDSTNIKVTSSAGFITGSPEMDAMLKIEDELIKYETIDGDVFRFCTRAQLNTIAASHEQKVGLNSFYTLSGNPIETSLKLMMSQAVDPIASGIIKNINQITPTSYIQDSIFIEDLFFADTYGLEGGEAVTITNSINPSNDVTVSTILNITQNETGTILTLNDSMVTEVDSTAIFTVKSQYDVLPDGLGMKHSQVDVLQHQTILEQYGNQFPDYVFYLKDTIKAKDFLAQQVYFPAGLYALTRKGRCSVQITVPPLNDGELVELTSANVLNPGDIAPERTINKYFYNNITYKYGLDSVTDAYLAGNITLSARSSNRLPVGNKPLEIVSDGLRDNADTTIFITRQARRFTDRFQFAAEKISIKTNFKTGFNVEVGDAVLFGDDGLKVYDSTTGSRDFKPRLMEVVNRSFSLTGANITLTLLDTQFSSDARYGTVSPNSIIDSGSTATSIKIIKSFSTGALDVERDKWTPFVGEKITIRDEDYSYTETTTLLSLDPADETRFTVFPALSGAPSAGYIVDLPPYDEGDDKMKSIHCFATPRVSIVNGTSGTVFNVSGSNISKFFVGGFVRIHDETFTVDSTATLDDDDLEITDITGNTITVNRDMGFTPSNSEYASLIGFVSDNGVPYRFT